MKLDLVTSLCVVTALEASAVVAVQAPECLPMAAPSQNVLPNVRTAQLALSGPPFGLSYAKNQPNIAFASVGRFLNVLDTSAFPPVLQYRYPLQDYISALGGGLATGLGLSHNGRSVFVCLGRGAVIFSAARAAVSRSDAVVGTLDGQVGGQYTGNSSIQVSTGLYDGYAFISQEYGPQKPLSTGNVDVFKLQGPNADGSINGSPVGYLNLGYSVVGSALSPNGKLLYVTSEGTARKSCSGGSLSVLDVFTLERNPSAALIQPVFAGYEPVRVIVSSDGQTVWVTARESNALLAFNANALISDPDNALIANVPVGTSPVDLTFVAGESRILTADSNRMQYAGAVSGISVVDVQAALSGNGRNAVLGRIQIPDNSFPREFAVSPDGTTVLVSLYNALSILAIDVSTLP